MNVPVIITDLSRDEIQSRIDETAAIVAGLRSEVSAINLRIREGEASIAAFNAEIARRRKRESIEPAVSDHALVRYIERCRGIDLESVRNHLLSEKVRTAIRAGASAVIIDGLKFVVANGTLVTVYEDRKPKNKAPKFRENEGAAE